MRAFVTGAGGFLGQALVRALAARGHAVRALIRSEAAAAPLESAGAELVRGDALDSALLRRAVAGCDAVFHLAGVRRATRREEFLRVNAGSTRLLLEACVETGAARSRFVLAGSLAACGPSRTGLREEDPFAPHEPYGESKAEAERIALSFRDQLPVAVARPPRIMGPGDRENLFFFRIANAGWVLAIGGGPRPLSWIDVDDCARGFVTLAEHPAAAGEVFFLAAEERTTVVDLQREVARALGARARELPLPPALVTGAAWLAEGIGAATGRRLPLNRKLARQVLAPGWTCEVRKARERLGFEARVSLHESAARAAASYRALGWLRPKSG